MARRNSKEADEVGRRVRSAKPREDRIPSASSQVSRSEPKASEDHRMSERHGPAK
jgi:hypothetical protein